MAGFFVEFELFRTTRSPRGPERENESNLHGSRRWRRAHTPSTRLHQTRHEVAVRTASSDRDAPHRPNNNTARVSAATAVRDALALDAR